MNSEKEETLLLYQKIREQIAPSLIEGDEENIRQLLLDAIDTNQLQRNVFGLNPILLSFQTALLVVEEIGLKRDSVLAVLLRPCVEGGMLTVDEVKDKFGESVARILHGLQRIQELYQKNPVIESENFRNLLLSFAEDMRVILIMIADRVNLMRQIKDTDNNDAKHEVSQEAAYLYAPLAHKLGLYKLKSELEDLSLKYLEHDAYYHIKEKLSETKKSRDAYIEHFIEPVSQRLTEAGIRFHIKAEMPLRGRLRPLRHPHHHRHSDRKGEDALLAGFCHCHLDVPAQPQALARLAERAEVQRLRVATHHRIGTRAEMGRGTDSHRAHGRDCRARRGCPLAL